MDEYPHPLVSSEIDLRDFPYMPLDVVRLRDSDLAAISSGDGFRAAVILWCASWHQIPAASLPDDDRILSNLAGFGRAVAEWLKVREDALRGFILCDDGRLYHPLISEKANDAWAAKQRQRARTEAARQAKLNQKKQGTCDDGKEVSVTESVTECVDDAEQPLSQAPRDRDRDRDREDSSSLRSDSASAEKPKSVRGSRLPADWMPDEAGRSMAAEALGNSGARAELAKFRDWAAAASGAKGVKADWNAAWRNWVRKAVEDGMPRAGPPRPDPQEIRNPALRALQRLSQKNAQRSDDLDIFAAASDTGQRTPSDGSSPPETGDAPGRFGPVLDLAAYR